MVAQKSKSRVTMKGTKIMKEGHGSFYLPHVRELPQSMILLIYWCKSDILSLLINM